MADALVVGAGPAGLSAALALRRAGADVEVLEQHPSPPPRVCGAFLNPEGASHLAALGLTDRVTDAGATQVEESLVCWAGAEPLAVPIVRGAHAGLALPRPVLERVMATALSAQGGSIRWGTRVTGASRGARDWTLDVVSGIHRATATAPLLVIADGRYSTLSGRPHRKTREGWFGWNASFVGADQRPGALSLHFYDDGYVGVLTFADGLSNVCGLVRLAGTLSGGWDDVFRRAMRSQPELSRLLRSATRVDPFRGVGPLPFSTGMVTRPGAVVAGDAAAVGDPYMGEGISRALGTGPALLAALAGAGTELGFGSRLDAYNRIWRGRYLPRLRLGTVGRWVFGRSRLSAPVISRLLRRPALLRRILTTVHGTQA